jgi:hypothetical protein
VSTSQKKAFSAKYICEPHMAPMEVQQRWAIQPPGRRGRCPGGGGRGEAYCWGVVNYMLSDTSQQLYCI